MERGGHMEQAEDLVDIAWRARREGRLTDAESVVVRAIADARRTGARRELIRALKALAHIVRDMDQDDRALPLYEEAVALSRTEGDSLLLAHTVRHLGDLYRGAGRIADAERCYDEALTLYRAAPDARALDFANALRTAALLKEALGDASGARQLWSEARQHYTGYQEAMDECDRHLSRLA